ncbi:LL-diaminopimelate aminotransferase [Campylobacter jejuni]|uniref:Aminotransferase, classes I and II n=1 Tax=Campylobacter jejuni subsp. jejuni serotype O:23/36 (strain 81-176) TaxID=354242 RepID=A0A0H3PF06_CAMJJ|nr:MULTISPECIES: LL-diaminopimelate aminotransferase [Campylobacter]EAK5450702.1 LL-diaminopimelate aminotransferase [Campylobacter hyointestinalis]ETJ82984.1 aspartate aminotransferase [Campylobacter jejuni subsp. jejuni 81-176-DRH212]ETN91389.1 aspartate aminotransferase [Campylobacter jejuni subsp. jejuni 81-176-UMCW9]ANS23273.1 aspartate aminotransferase [Campylobacter jejuni subsp. jejuni]AOW96546.1 aspartate aminotransferase [Campylobacter jejuni subsp. jejuni str. RM3420]
MFDEIRFNTIERLPNYVFAEVNAIKMAARRAGEDIIDFSMGNPDGKTPQHIIDKLCESANKDKTSGYSTSMGIYKLRLAICNWYKRKYNVNLDPENEVVATMGSKEGFVNLARAIINPGDVAIVPTPAYPIHTQAFIIAGGNVAKMPLAYNEKFELDENQFFENLHKTLNESIPRPKYVVVNFPHNPTTVTCEKSFYERLIATAKKERFYIISDIAYADLTYDDYKTPSILEIEGAKDVAVETYTLSKSYNMAGWRVGFVVGNKRLVSALKKIKSWFDYGMYTPIQVAATIALDGDQTCVDEIRATYDKRMHILLEAFENAGWKLQKPRASMFVWAKLPESKRHLKSLEFSKQLLQRASVAVSPGVGFGEAGDEYVRIALIENENRIRQATRNIKKYLKE